MKIKFVTLNIWEGGKLFDSVTSFIKKEDSDIIVMQEVKNGRNPNFEKNSRTMDAFKEDLKYPYFVFSPAFLNKLSVGDVDEGNAIFSRFPIVSNNVTFFDNQYGEFNSLDSKYFELIPGILQHAVIEIENLKLNIFNAHGIWGFDGRDNERRLKMSETIVNKIKDKENVVLAGDFNIQPNTKTIQNIEHHLKNVFKDELATTFNMTRKINGGYAKAVVDMVFVSKNIKVQEHFCPNVDISDHLPLVCTLEL
ncbi:MAG: endonuclease/exonuclease/phosphatase family protein [Patescibacteria group bacterium]